MGTVLDDIFGKQTQLGTAGLARRSGTKSAPIADIAKRFDLLGRTGQGSMSKVYRAYDNKLGRIGLSQGARQGQDRQVRGTLQPRD